MSRPTSAEPASAEPAKRRSWERRSEARPAEIVDAALDVFVERGYAAAKMDEIAERAGVTKGTVYLYFQGKEDLFRAVVHRTVLPNLETGERLVAEFTGSTPELFRTLVRRWWQSAGETRLACLPKLIMGEAANFPALAGFYVEEVIHRGRRMFAAAIRRGIERGEFREVDVDTAVRLAMGAMTGALAYRRSLLAYDTEPFDFEAYVEMHIDFFLRGLAKDPTDPDASHA
ncbi:MAG: TetR/AcrR family transcriptional regulator [Longimicrobiaceae bacterium]